MARKTREKGKRQNEQREKFEALQYDLLHDEDDNIRDFYDYVKVCLAELDKLKKPERIFSRVMKNKLTDLLTEKCQTSKPKVEDYILYIAEQLTEWTPALVRWTNGTSWGIPVKEIDDGTEVLDLDKIRDIWIQTVKQWWDEDTFPRINEGRGEGKTGKKEYSFTYEKRDVALFVLMIFGFTVKECDEFLEELCLVKDSDVVRPLYALDFKECLFRWILLWNENHEEKISYAKACSYYREYGTTLLMNMRLRVPNVCSGLDAYIGHLEREKELEAQNADDRKNYEKRIEAFIDLKESCLGIMQMIPDSENALYEHKHAENLKRLMALTEHLERKLVRINKELSSSIYKTDSNAKLREFRQCVENTRVNRGTKYAWSELSRYADERQMNFEESFKRFQEKSVEFISEAYWSQYSQLNRLAIRSEIVAENNPLIKESAQKKKDENKFTILEEAIDNLDEKNLSFAYDGKDIQSMMINHTNTRVIMTNLLKPVRRHDVDDRLVQEASGSSGVSQMMNAYHKWCTGENADTPNLEFRREKVLKVALAAGVEDEEGLRAALKLSGRGEFQYLDKKEALVYLMTYYCDELKACYDDITQTIKKILDSGFVRPNWKAAWINLNSQVTSLPKEYRVSIPENLKKKMDREAIPANERARMTNMVNEWANEQYQDLIERIPFSLVERLREADFMMILFSLEQEDLEEIRKKLFYGPYTNDFLSKKQTRPGKKKEKELVEKQNAWLQVIVELYSAMKQIFTEEGVKQLFSFAYFIPEDMTIDEVVKLSAKGVTDKNVQKKKEEHRYELADPYCNLVEVTLSESLNGMGKEEIVKSSEEQIHEILETFEETVKASAFLNQAIPALESRYILEQWACVLAALNHFGIDVSKEKQGLNETLKIWEQGAHLL